MKAPKPCSFDPRVLPVISVPVLRTMGLITGLSLMVATAPLAAADTGYSFTGTAYGENGEPIYQESHTIQGSCDQTIFSTQSDEVIYSSTGDAKKQIGSKELTYSESDLRPSYVMTQTGFNEKMTVTNKNDESVVINWQEPDGKTQNTTLEITDDMVFDSGFVYLIQQNWKALNNDEVVSFEFLSATRGETYGFEATAADDDQIDAHLTVRMQPAGTILGWLVDPITLGFDDKGRLTDYLGLTNVRKDGDDNYRAHIRYETPDLPCALVEGT